jgi:hypothetical protein
LFITNHEAIVKTSCCVLLCVLCETINFVYYESRKRELKRRLINEGRCDERLKAKVEESTFLTRTVGRMTTALFHGLRVEQGC